MYKVEIGLGFIVTALAGFNLLNSIPANIVLVVIGIALVLHGGYEVIFKPRYFLQKRIVKWLLRRNWKVKTDQHPNFYLIINAEDDSHREISITRDKKDNGILAFTIGNLVHPSWISGLNKLSKRERALLLEDIKILFTNKDMAYETVKWPLDKLAIQHALPLDQNLSEHLVDLEAKSVINTGIGVRSLIRKAITHLEADMEEQQFE